MSTEPRTIDPLNPPKDLRNGEVVRLLGKDGRLVMKIDPFTRMATDQPAEFTVSDRPLD